MAALVAFLVALTLALTACAPTALPDAGLRVARLTLPTDPTPTVTASVTATASATATTTPGATATPQQPPAISALRAELFDASSGKTLYALNQDDSVPMASTTKIMTAVVALTYGRLDQRITVGQDVVAIEDGGTSVAGLRLGETMSLRNLLYCLMLPSGDDAAIAIADGVGGSQAGFVALMNVEAGLLGLSHTHYVNPHGLDQDGHYTSASDLVRLAAFAMTSPTFRQIVATPAMTIPANANHHTFDLVNTNELLPTQPFAYTGAIGVKTGFTGGAGYCLVFVAERSGVTLVGAVLGEPTYNGRFTDATALLDWGFAQTLPSGASGATPTTPPSATPAATASAAP